MDLSLVAEAEWLDDKRAHKSRRTHMHAIMHACVFVRVLLSQAEREGQPERAGQDL